MPELLHIIHAYLTFRNGNCQCCCGKHKKFSELYVPRFLKKGTFVFFAIDNTDFAEDTVDVKGTTHSTITAVHQKVDAPGEPITLNQIPGWADSEFKLF